MAEILWREKYVKNSVIQPKSHLILHLIYFLASLSLYQHLLPYEFVKYLR